MYCASKNPKTISFPIEARGVIVSAQDNLSLIAKMVVCLVAIN